MSSLFGQVWLWSLLAFVVGALATWTLFVAPARKRITVLEERVGHFDKPRESAGSAPAPTLSTVTPPAPEDDYLESIFDSTPPPKPPPMPATRTAMLPVPPEALPPTEQPRKPWDLEPAEAAAPTEQPRKPWDPEPAEAAAPTEQPRKPWDPEPEDDDRPLFFEAETPAFGIPKADIDDALNAEPAEAPDFTDSAPLGFADQPTTVSPVLPAPAPAAPELSAPAEVDVTDTELADHRPATPVRPAQRVAPPPVAPRPTVPADELRPAPLQSPVVPPPPSRPITPALVERHESPAPDVSERTRSLFEPIVDPGVEPMPQPGRRSVSEDDQQGR